MHPPRLITVNKTLTKASMQLRACRGLSVVTQPTRVQQGRRCSPVIHRQQQRPVRVSSAAQTDVSSASSSSSSSSGASEQTGVPPGCARYSISIKKPLGLVLEQNKETGVITVVEVAEEGNAARTGLVAVGDQLVATSGVVYNKEADYGGATVKMGQEVVRLQVLGESFKTVSAAIGSHPGHMEVKLEFQRC